MTNEEHRKFRFDVDKSINAICGHLFRGETLSEDELGAHIDNISKLNIEYNSAISTLNEIRSKIRWHFNENQTEEQSNE